MENSKLQTKYFSLILISLFAFFPTFAFSQNISKKQQNNYIINLLKSENFDYFQQNLSQASSDFCPNILLSFPGKKNEQELVYCFSQDFAEKNPDFILNFLNFLRDNVTRKLFNSEILDYNTTVLFYPDSENKNLPKGKNIISGLSAYQQNIYETDNLCVIILEDQSVKGNFISVNSKNNICPSWLTHLIKKAGIESGKKLILPELFNFLFQEKLSPDNENIEFFLENNIPAIAVGISSKTEDLTFLKNIAWNFSASYNKKNYRLYSFITVFKDIVWLEEYFFISLYLFAAAISLFYLCFLPVTGFSRKKAILTDLKRSWFTIPLAILIYIIIFTLIQFVFSFTKNNVPLNIALNLIFSIFLILFLNSLQVIFDFRFSFDATEISMAIIASINLIIFGCHNLCYITFFIYEYLVIHIFKYSTTPAVNLISLILLIIPFEFLFAPMQIYSDPVKFAGFTGDNYLKNIGLAFIFYPIAIHWLRTMTSMGLIEKQDSTKSLKKNILNSIYGILVFLAILFSSYTGVYFITRPDVKKENNIKPIIKTVDESDNSETLEIQIKYSQENYFDLTTRKINLSSKENILRYEVFIESEKPNPVLDCNYTYSLENDHLCAIQLPDFPFDDVEIIFTTDKINHESAKVNVYIQKIPEEIIKKTYNIVF